jgi:hypothetical protein
MISADRRKQRLQEKIRDVSVDLKREVKAREGLCSVQNTFIYLGFCLPYLAICVIIF